jgi:alginate O-acetyltransferase complex protein AlgI
VLFTDNIFLFYFLPAALLLHRLAVGRASGRYPALARVTLFLLTLVFYAYRDVWWIYPFLASVAFDFLWASLLMRTERPAARRLLVGVSIAQNLALLSLFKYRDFLRPWLPWIPELRQDGASLALPAGISFYTFESLSFVIDVYRREITGKLGASDFFGFIGMFPRFIAGPIARYRPIVRQFREYPGMQLERGLPLFAAGLFLKACLADQFAVFVPYAFDQGFDPGFIGAWIGTVSYAMQIYFDFSGYSLMAIGLGLCLGFEFPSNFERPYLAASLRDFWRRWHITLSSWLRDYLYIPLGGGRRGTARTYLNIFITMLLGGMWHGAQWTFVLWGAWHGVLLCVERGAGWDAGRPHPLKRAWVLAGVGFGWILFRASSVPQALYVARSLFAGPGARLGPFDSALLHRHPVSVLAAAFGLVYCFALEGRVDYRLAEYPAHLRGACAFGLIVVSLILLKSTPSTWFLYFTF